MGNIRIAVDAMGGDNGPSIVVPAALKALERHHNLEIILVGIESILLEQLKELVSIIPSRLILLNASQVVGMDEAPAVALRTKRDSSMRQAINLVKDHKAHACVSAGNTGALMATARFVLKMIPGVDRPAIINQLPTIRGSVFILDLGANVDCQAPHLLQFAVMGSALAQMVKGIEKPRVALLNIGSELIKGSEVIKQAAQLISQVKDLNFIGFVEGDDIYKGAADVIVCDGFVGNVALKTSEGLAHLIFSFTKEEFSRNIFRKFIAFLAKPILKSIVKRFDPSRYNGANLLGLKNIVIKSHGNTSIEGFYAAIKAAMMEVEKDVSSKMANQVALQLGKVVPL
ncbi:MAG: phosphate acyltransferase [Francisellaceae bacterium]|nr:phosphate acyltransferase [Francisellaceae bacterium]